MTKRKIYALLNLMPKYFLVLMLFFGILVFSSSAASAGSATAKDFYDLAKQQKQKVEEKFGITLEPEVQLVNLPPI